MTTADDGLQSVVGRNRRTPERRLSARGLRAGALRPRRSQVIDPAIGAGPRGMAPSGGDEHGAQCQHRQHLQPRTCGDDAVPSLLKQPDVNWNFSSLSGSSQPGVDGGADSNVDDEPDCHCEHRHGACERRAEMPSPSDRHGSRYGGAKPDNTWHAEPPVPKVVHSAHGAHKSPIVHQGKCRTENDRRKDVCSVDDPGCKHGHHSERLAKRRHVVLSGSPRSNAGIIPICWKSSRRLSSSQCSTNSPLPTRQMSMERISIVFPVGGIP